ncbi:MAG: MFS transporter [Alphaproteobacteria bacterium]|nr:MFS transporter [Alphaproteobacteria bacterium]
MTVRAEESVETAYGWVVVVASHLLVATAIGATYLIIVSLKPIAAEFDWPRSIPSLAYAVAMLGAGIGGIVMGYWSDRRGLGGVSLLGAVMVGAGAIVVSSTTHYWGLLVTCALLLGFLGGGTVLSPLMTNATRWFDRRRGLAVAIVASGQAVAGAVWPNIFQYGIDFAGWRETWFWFGVFAICAMLPLSMVVRRRPPTPLTLGVGGLGGAAYDIRSAPKLVLVLLGVAIICCCVAMAMPAVHLVAMCSDLGFGADNGARMLSFLLACSFASRLGFGWLSDRIGGLKTILIGSTLQAITLSTYIWVDGLVSLYALSGAFGLAYGGIVPAYTLAIRELFPAREAGWRIGVIFLCGMSGMALGGWLGGWIFDLMGHYQFAFVTGVFFNLANLSIICFLLWLAGGRAAHAVA